MKTAQTKKRLLFVLTFSLFIILFLFYFFKTSIWDGEGKFILAVDNKENVLVSVFDPRHEAITNILIPNNVQVMVAGELGTWKLGSVWQLGRNEGRDGDLLAKTISKNFGFPVYAWGDFKAAGFSDRKIKGILSASFGRYKTSLRIGDRIKLGFFALRIGSVKRTSIDLSDVRNGLKEKTFLDGSRGFVIQGNIPDRIVAVFPDDVSANKDYKAKVVLKTEKPISPDSVSRVIEVMGVKIASVVKENPEDINCLVGGKDDKLVKLIALVLGCKGEKEKSGGSFDIEVVLGERFNKNF